MGYKKKGIVLMLALGMAMPVNASAAAVSVSSGSNHATDSVSVSSSATNERAIASTESSTSAADMEAKLRIVKSRINIPDEYKNFDYYQSSFEDVVSYEFTWNNGSSGSDWKYISAGITGNFISRYWISEKSEPSYSAHFGKISKVKAREYADAWLKKVNPEQYPNIRIVEENSYSDLQTQTISFQLRYEHDGVPVHNMSGNIVVSTQTGVISNYYLDWQKVDNYPDKAKAISPERAKELYEASIGLKPVYRVYSDGYGKTSSFIAYIQKNAGKVINAVTGEAEGTSSYYMLNSQSKNATTEAAMDTGGMGGNVRLTPAELEKLEQTAGLISVAEAEKLARDNKYTEIPAGMKLVSSTLEENRYEKGRYQWYLSFMSTEEANADMPMEKLNLMIAAGEVDIDSNVNVTLDASEGDIIGINRYKYRPYPEVSVSVSEIMGKETQYDRYKDFAQTAFNSLLGKKAAEYKLVDTEATDSSYSFVRFVNGIEFPDNSFNMSIDNDGKISYLGGSYYNIDFANPNGLIGEKAALESAFKAVPYKMIYDVTRYYRNDYTMLFNTEPRLLYTWEDSAFQIDAKTGKVVDYRGKEVSEYYYSGYEGLDDSVYKDEINKMGEYGIYIRNASAHVDAAISQKDFMSLCANVFWGYYMDDEYMYERLIREGVIKSYEKAPEMAVTRDHLAKYLAAFMRIGEYSNLDGIFVKPYEDVVSNIGSVAILKALKVIDITGDSFEPSKTVTIGEAIHYFYNYMNR